MNSALHNEKTRAKEKGETRTNTIEILPIEQDVAAVFGDLDENVRVIEREYGVHVSLTGEGVRIEGEEGRVRQASALIEALARISGWGEEVDKSVVARTAQLIADGQADRLGEIYGSVAGVTGRGKKLRVKSAGQLAYTNAIKGNTVVIAIGPAGTGKTFLAVAAAVNALRAGQVRKIILTRPAIEAGEKLGFLPGDLQMKVDPYLRPLYDALEELMGESYLHMVERGVLEIAPLAYMRGRTLKSAFVILDEAQNTTCEQMKMFLTRLGEGSKMIVEGDETQIDLPPGRKSGLIDAAEVLKSVEGVAVVRLGKGDVVRHELVQRIVQAYDQSVKGE